MPLEIRTYSDIRQEMRRGDVIAFGGKELFSTIVKGITGSQTVTHVARQGRAADYQRVIDTLKSLEAYFEAYPRSRLKKTEANKLREAVYKRLGAWNHGSLPDEACFGVRRPRAPHGGLATSDGTFTRWGQTQMRGCVCVNAIPVSARLPQLLLKRPIPYDVRLEKQSPF